MTQSKIIQNFLRFYQINYLISCQYFFGNGENFLFLINNRLAFSWEGYLFICDCIHLYKQRFSINQQEMTWMTGIHIWNFDHCVNSFENRASPNYKVCSKRSETEFNKELSVKFLQNNPCPIGRALNILTVSTTER